MGRRTISQQKEVAAVSDPVHQAAEDQEGNDQSGDEMGGRVTAHIEDDEDSEELQAEMQDSVNLGDLKQGASAAGKNANLGTIKGQANAEE